MKHAWLALRAMLAAALLPGVVGILIPRWIGGGTLFGARHELVDDAAFLLLGAGALLLLTCIAYFAVVGRGTLAPVDPPTVFVARGPYRFSRNPMYVGVLSWLAGLAVLMQNPRLGIYTVAIATLFHLFITRVEEPGLRRRFGATYDDYCRRVPRWLGRVRGLAR